MEQCSVYTSHYYNTIPCNIVKVQSAGDAEAAARQWVYSKYPGAQDVSFNSVMPAGPSWIVELSFREGSNISSFRVTVSADGDVTGYQSITSRPAIQTSELGEILIIVSLVISAIIALVLFISGIARLFLGAVFFFTGPLILISAVISIIVGLIDAYLTVEINNIRKMVEERNYRGAAETLSLGFIIVAFIFEFLITGILLFIAREELRSKLH